MPSIEGLIPTPCVIRADAKSPSMVRGNSRSKIIQKRAIQFLAPTLETIAPAGPLSFAVDGTIILGRSYARTIRGSSGHGLEPED